MIVIGSLNLSLKDTFATDTGNNTPNLKSAAKEFESVLLGQWLKDAESTFGRVPGGEEEDSGGQQMKEFAMQHVASDLVDRGGIGIAPMVEKALAKQQIVKVPQSREESTNPETGLWMTRVKYPR